MSAHPGFNSFSSSPIGAPAKFTILGLAALLYLCWPSAAWAAERQVVRGHVLPATAGLAPKGPLDPAKRMKLAIGLPVRDQKALDQFLKDLSDPASPKFRKFITPAQFAEQFGPTKKDYDALAAFATAQGLTITKLWADRLLLFVEGDVAHVQKAFHIHLLTYQHPIERRLFYAPDAEPSLDLAVPILHISGLDNSATLHSGGSVHPAGLTVPAGQSNGSGTDGYYGGGDFRAAYVPGTVLAGAGQSVALLEFDGYNSADIQNYINAFPNEFPGGTGVPLTIRPVDNYSEAADTSITNGVLEVDCDIEMVNAMAPGLSTIYVYEAPYVDSNSAPYLPWVAILEEIYNDNFAKQISCSWYESGITPTSPTTIEPNAQNTLMKMATQGQTFFAASGDTYAYTGPIPFPYDSPYVTVVGGTTISTAPLGTIPYYSSETVWNDGDGGSSGGISTFYSFPSWQTGFITAANEGSTSMRNTPDVAAIANNLCFFVNGVPLTNYYDGTSFAAPLWAAFTALVNQEAASNSLPAVGFLNPALYANAKNFNNKISGNNFSATSPTRFPSVQGGYDLCTGLGTPTNSLLLALGSAPGAQPNLTFFQPSTWSDKVIVSNILISTAPNPFTDSSPLSSTDTLYVSFAPANTGSAAVIFNWTAAISVDGSVTRTFPVSLLLNKNTYVSSLGYSIGSLSAGQHTIAVTLDTGHTIGATSAVYSKTITVNGPSYTVTASAGPNGSVAAPTTVAVASGGSATFTAVPNSGYAVQGWSINGVLQANTSAENTFTVNNVAANLNVTVTFVASATAAQIISPAPGSILQAAAQGFSWTSGTAATGYELLVGNSRGASDIIANSYVAGVTSALVSGFPTDGRTLYVTLVTETSAVNDNLTFVGNTTGSPLYNYYTYTAATPTYQVTASAGPNGSITPSGVLQVSSSGTTFTAKPNTGYVVNQWIVNGSVVQQGGLSYPLSNVTGATTVSVSFAVAPTAAQMEIPTPGSTLANSSVTFTWSAGSGATQYWLGVQNSQGAYLYNGYLAAGVTSANVTGLPTDGSAVTVTLLTYFSGSYSDYTYSYTAAKLYTVTPFAGANGSISPSSSISVFGGANQTFTATPNSGYVVNQWLLNGTVVLTAQSTYTLDDVSANDIVAVTFNPQYGTAQMETPAPGSKFSSSAVTFTWNAGFGASAYWLYVGSSLGGSDIFNSGSLGLGVLSAAAPAIPTDGRTVYVRLWTGLNGAWQSNDYTYTAETLYTVTPSVSGGSGSVSPSTAASVSPGGSVTFTATPGAGNVVSQWLLNGLAAQAGGASYTVTDVTANESVEVIFAPAPTAALMTAPAPGATFSGTSVTFQWTAGIGNLSYDLYVGSSLGANDLYSKGFGAGVLSAAVPNLPTDSRTIYVRLWTYATGGVFLPQDYTYTAAHLYLSLGALALLEGPGSGTDSVELIDTTPSGGEWTAAANASWLHINAGSASGKGPAIVIFTFDANTGGTRSGTLTVGGQMLSVTQAGSTYVAAGAVTALVFPLGEPEGVAVDGSGNVYIADSVNNAIKELPLGASAPITLVSTGLNDPLGVAVDGFGNVYFADTFNNAIKELPLGAPAPITLVSTGLRTPSGVAVDGSGNVYIADTANNAIKELAPGAPAPITLVSTGLSNPFGVAVDGSGNVYIADTTNGAIKKLPPGASAPITLVSTGLSNPDGVAVDGSGNVYIADVGNNAIKEYVAATQSVRTLVAAGLDDPGQVAVDGSRNLYIADFDNNAIKELPRAFVDPTSKTETSAAGSDVLPTVLPATENLLPPFAPTSDQTWLTIGAISSGVVNFSFTANTATSSRTAHITVLGQSVAVTQEPKPVLGASSLVAGPGGGANSIILSTGAAWTAVSNASWIHVSAGSASGTGASTIHFTVDPNTGATRIGTITVAGQMLTVTQAGSTYSPAGLLTLVSTGLSDPSSVAVDGSGNVYIADTGNNAIKEAPRGAQTPITLVSSGLHFPNSVAVDGSGDIYIADTFNAAIKELPMGAQTLGTLVSGLGGPKGVAVDSLENVYIADTSNNVIRELPVGAQTPIFLPSGGLLSPFGVTVDGSGNIYIADTGNNAIKELAPGAQALATLTSAGLDSPRGVAVDGSGNVYIADTANNAIKELVPGAQAPITLVSTGLASPGGVAVDGSGNVYIADTENNEIEELANAFVDTTAVSELPAAGADALPVVVPLTANLQGACAPTSDEPWLTITSTAGGVVSFSFTANTATFPRIAHISLLGQSVRITQEPNPSLGASSLVAGPGGVANSIILSTGAAWTATSNASWIHVNAGSASGTGASTILFTLDPNTGTTRTGTITVAGQTLTVTQAGSTYSAAGVITLVSTGLSVPYGVAADGSGNVYIADTGNNAIKELALGAQTPITLISAGLVAPFGVAVDGSGNVYIADTENNAIKELALGAQTPNTLVSTGLNSPRGVAVDGSGNVYIADFQNSVIKELALGAQTPITLVSSSGLDEPAGVAVDGSGNVYVADTYDNAIEELALGTQTPVTLVSAGLNLPFGVAVDGSGNVYIADTFNNAIKELAPGAQTPSTLVSTGIDAPEGVAVDGPGNVYIADTSNNEIKELPRAFVDRTALSEPPAAGADALPVVVPVNANLQGACAPVSDEPWLTITSTAGGSVSFSFTANPGTISRTAHVTVLGVPVAITQEPNPSLGASSLVAGPGGGADSILLSTGGAWTATSNASWLHLDAGSASGTGASTILFSLDPNTGATRTGTITVAGQTLTVTQAGSTYSPAGLLTLVSTGLDFPVGVAVDGSGNVYIADSFNNAIKKLALGAQTPITLVSTGLSDPFGVAVDGSGNVYIADSQNNAVKELVSGAQTPITLVSTGLDFPEGVAVDGSGNVYITDTGNSAIKELTPGAQTPITLVSTGLGAPSGVAVDGSGNVYIADDVVSNYAINELRLGAQTPATLVSTGLSDPFGVAVDGSGNVYIADTQNNAVKELAPGAQTPITLVSTGLAGPEGVAVDGSGNVYITDTQNNAIKELPNAFIDPTPKAEAPGAGSDSLTIVMPSGDSLSALFAPASDQPWLTIGAVDGGVVNFTFGANTTTLPRTAHITVLGIQVPVTQAAPAPSNLVYSTNPAIYVVGYFVSNSPTSSGGTVDSYSVAPSLPQGLSLESSTGVIYGAPQTYSLPANYVVTATNSGGTAKVTLNIEVAMLATSGGRLSVTLSASDANATFTIVDQPQHGLLLGTTPNLLYVANAAYAGFDSFTYETTIGGVTSAPQTVPLYVIPPVSVSGHYFGTYVGLISGPDASHAGAITVTLTAYQTFTAVIRYRGKTYRLKGGIDSNGNFVVYNNSPLGIALKIGLPDGPDVVTGTVGLGASTLTWSPVLAAQAVYSAKIPTAQAGRYTVMIPPDPAQTNGSGSPQGYGVGTLSVAKTGTIAFAGTLADGAKFSYGTSLTRGGVWYLYLPLYATTGPLQGMLEGTIQFQETPQVSDLDGAVTWIRPGLTKFPYPKSALYPAGFTLSPHLFGAAYEPAGNLVLAPKETGNMISVEGGSVPGGSLLEAVQVSKTAAGFKVTGSGSLSLSVAKATGIVSGRFKETPKSAASPVNAVIYQNGPAPTIVGNFTDRPAASPNEGGAVTLSGP